MVCKRYAVSIPAGFSDALRPSVSLVWTVYEFQSLLGFLMRCDHVMGLRDFGQEVVFQSLLGFLMRCDHCYEAGILEGVDVFQSLLGFLMRATTWLVMYGSR